MHLVARSGGDQASTPAIDGPRVIVQLARRDGDRARPRDPGRSSGSVQTARQGRVVAGRRRRPGLLRLDRRPALRGARRARARPLGVRHRRPDQREPVRLRQPRLHLHVRGLDLLPRIDGPARRSGRTYFKRDSFRYESFYASPSTDGARIYYRRPRRARSYALDARTGRLLWTGRVGGSGTRRRPWPTGRVFVGGFDGTLRALRATTGRELWQVDADGRILGAPSSSATSSSSRRSSSGRTACACPTARSSGSCRMGKYSPGIATERTTSSRSTGASSPSPAATPAEGRYSSGG